MVPRNRVYAGTTAAPCVTVSECPIPPPLRCRGMAWLNKHASWSLPRCNRSRRRSQERSRRSSGRRCRTCGRTRPRPSSRSDRWYLSGPARSRTPWLSSTSSRRYPGGGCIYRERKNESDTRTCSMFPPLTRNAYCTVSRGWIGYNPITVSHV